MALYAHGVTQWNDKQECTTRYCKNDKKKLPSLGACGRFNEESLVARRRDVWNTENVLVGDSLLKTRRDF